MRLKDARRARRWTQAQLRDRSGVAQQEISRLENGLVRKPAYASVIRLCRALGVRPADIDEFREGVDRE